MRLFFLCHFTDVNSSWCPYLPLDSAPCRPGSSCRWHSGSLGPQLWPWASLRVLHLLLCSSTRSPGRNESCIQQQRPPQRSVCTPCWSDRTRAGRLVLHWDHTRLKTWGSRLNTWWCTVVKNFQLSWMCPVPPPPPPLHVCVAATGDLFDPFGMGSGSGVGSSVGSSRQASGPDLFGDLLGSDSSATSGFSSGHGNPTPASNTSLFNLSKCVHCSSDASSYLSVCDPEIWWSITQHYANCYLKTTASK